jgi:hypothetical protein
VKAVSIHWDAVKVHRSFADESAYRSGSVLRAAETVPSMQQKAESVKAQGVICDGLTKQLFLEE